MATFLKDDQNVLVRDQNRYRKIYRYIRKKPRPLNCEGSDISNFVWGSYFVEFNNQSEVTHHFPCCYESPPAVIATTVMKGSHNPNFNVFVTDITSSQCTFRTSGYYTGYVYYQALVDGAYTMPNIGKSLEVKTLQFNGTDDIVTHSFTAAFECVPIVTVTADEDVNAFVTALSKTSVTVEVSKAGYTGKVYLQAIEKGC